jgi:hypothetical protein
VAVQERLQAVLDYACGPDGADCKGIQLDAMCFEPNTMVFEKRLGKASFPRFKIFFLPPLQLLISRPRGPRIEDQATSTLKTQR